jgi:hypothetical protein
MTLLSLTERQRVADAACRLHELLAFDDLWSAHLGEAESSSDVDVAALQVVVDRMEALWGPAIDGVGQIRSICEDRPSAVEQAYDLFLQSDQLAQEHKEEWQRRVAEHGGPVALARSDLTQFIDSAQEERRVILDKMSRIRNGEFVEGDLSVDGRCYGWAGLAVGLGIAGSFPTPLSPVFWAWAFMAAATAGSACRAAFPP